MVRGGFLTGASSENLVQDFIDERRYHSGDRETGRQPGRVDACGVDQPRLCGITFDQEVRERGGFWTEFGTNAGAA